MPLRRTLLLLVSVGLVAVVALPAGAHTQVKRATPGPGQTVSGEVGQVELEFLDEVLPTPEIVVSGPDGEPVAGLVPAELTGGDVAVARFDPLTDAGQYQVDYTFVALDGDEQVSAHTFTFAPDDGLDARRLLAGLVGVTLVALVVAALVGRRRSGA